MAICINRGNYLFVENPEPFSFKRALVNIQEVSDHCKRDSLDKVLFDMSDFHGHISILERYEIGKEIAKVLGPRIKMAVVTNFSVINYLMENSAVNRGAKIKVFSEMDKALEWLDVAG